MSDATANPAVAPGSSGGEAATSPEVARPNRADVRALLDEARVLPPGPAVNRVLDVFDMLLPADKTDDTTPVEDATTATTEGGGQ